MRDGYQLPLPAPARNRPASVVLNINTAPPGRRHLHVGDCPINRTPAPGHPNNYECCDHPFAPNRTSSTSSFADLTDPSQDFLAGIEAGAAGTQPDWAKKVEDGCVANPKAY
ncbi:MAG: hypothetical protein WCP28_08600 [Actinomycetes bacterium]